MNLRSSSRKLTAVALIGIVLQAIPAPGRDPVDGTPGNHAAAKELRAVLLSPDQLDEARLAALRRDGVNGIALAIGAVSPEDRARERKAIELVFNSPVDLWYWIEIARDPALAARQPRWMASLQGHGEWRRLFKDPPRPGDGEVVKNYPWVPILYEEAFDAHLARVKALLERLPASRGVFLNDLQGAPSACGCGNILCRWTADYGPIVTATPLGPDAAARFLSEVRKLAPRSEVIPVWTTECEEHDGAPEGACAGVGCFKGRCWKEYEARLTLVLEKVDRIGVLLPYKNFQREIPAFETRAGWVRHALESFTRPSGRTGAPALGRRARIAVLQGWDVTEEEITSQIEHAREGGASGYVISHMKIDQSWKPRIVKVR